MTTDNKNKVTEYEINIRINRHLNWQNLKKIKIKKQTDKTWS